MNNVTKGIRIPQKFFDSSDLKDIEMNTNAQGHIMYVGPLAEGGTCLNRLEALQRLGFSIIPVDTDIPSTQSAPLKLFYKLWRRFGSRLWRHRINRRMLVQLDRKQPDMVWIDKGLQVQAKTLQQIKASKPDTLMLSYSPDDMLNTNNQSDDYLECIPLMDIHVTTKSFNVNELQELGAREVLFVHNSYCCQRHKPITLSNEERVELGGRVGFIGFWEPEREQYMRYLAENNIPVRIWGPWKRSLQRLPNFRVEGKVAWGPDYARTLNAFDINLCFLRKENRDLQTSRSIEIPACGGFMLAERTDEHLTLFEEGKEAEFFDSKEELLSKTEYYLAHETERRRIAAAGRQRCLDSAYSDEQKLSRILHALNRWRREPSGDEG